MYTVIGLFTITSIKLISSHILAIGKVSKTQGHVKEIFGILQLL